MQSSISLASPKDVPGGTVLDLDYGGQILHYTAPEVGWKKGQMITLPLVTFGTSGTFQEQQSPSNPMQQTEVPSERGVIRINLTSPDEDYNAVIECWGNLPGTTDDTTFHRKLKGDKLVKVHDWEATYPPLIIDNSNLLLFVQNNISRIITCAHILTKDAEEVRTAVIEEKKKLFMRIVGICIVLSISSIITVTMINLNNKLNDDDDTWYRNVDDEDDDGVGAGMVAGIIAFFVFFFIGTMAFIQTKKTDNEAIMKQLFTKMEFSGPDKADNIKFALF